MSKLFTRLSRVKKDPEPVPKAADKEIVNSNGNGAPHDPLGLGDIYKKAKKKPEESKAEKVLETLGNGVLAVQEHQENSMTMAGGFKILLDQTGGTDAIEDGINGFIEHSEVLMKALDNVAKLHPFVGVAVIAFKTVWTLEMTRRENNKRIMALHAEMTDTISVLTQLEGIKDPKAVGPDGQTIEDRMKELVEKTAEDIKRCAGVCDAFEKQKLIVKVLKGPVWSGSLLKFVELFVKRRGEFEYALTIHTALGVDALNDKMDDNTKITQDINAKMDLMMKMFQQSANSEERDMMTQVQRRGGIKSCLKSDRLLKELEELEEAEYSDDLGGDGGLTRAKFQVGRRAADAPDFDKLKEDLNTDPEDAVKKNLEIFSRKFEIQKRQLLEEMDRIVRREGDRIISAINSGPHENIVDPDLYELWKEERWRWSVKTRHFVLSLRDFYQDKWKREAESRGVTIPDAWTLIHLSIIHLQPLSEAFDDDVSGFVTVAEANAFTTLRPLEWSLPHWIAYWAAGWHQRELFYVREIRLTMSKMFSLLPDIRPANLPAVHDYIESVYRPISTLVVSVNSAPIDEALHAHFKKYTEAEELRLKRNLEAVKYDIDALDTLSLVTGPGSIEKFVLPLLHLMLKRDLEIFRVCRKVVTHPDELWDSADTIDYVMDAVKLRVRELTAIFKQQKVDVQQHFKSFAHGLFAYYYTPSALWTPERVRKWDYPEHQFDDSEEGPEPRPKDILNHEFNQEELDLDVYRSPVDHFQPISTDASSQFSRVLGVWNGYIYHSTEDAYPLAGMISMALYAQNPEAEDGAFRSTGRYNNHDFVISGTCSDGENDGSIIVDFKQSFPTRLPTKYYRGHYDFTSETLSGFWGYDPEETERTSPFIFKRISSTFMCFRPAPSMFAGDKKPGALWKFALSAVHHQVKRQAWSRSLITERRTARKRFIHLRIRYKDFGPPLSVEDFIELSRLRMSFTAEDNRFYHSLAAAKARRTTGHGVYCDVCKGNIGGARLICLVCEAKEHHTLDICDSPQCMAEPVVHREDLIKPHLQGHDIVKVRRRIFIRQFGRMDRAAKEALELARASFAGDRPQTISNFAVDGEKLMMNVGKGKIGGTIATSSKAVGPGAAPTCANCKLYVQKPCWYCVECEDTFICEQCDRMNPKDLKIEGHHRTHDLVRCRDAAEDEGSLEGRLSLLEKHFSKHEAAVDGQLRGMQTTVDERLSRLETLLESLLHATQNR